MGVRKGTMSMWQITRRYKEDSGYSYTINHIVSWDEEQVKYDEVRQPRSKLWVYVIKQKYPDDAFCEAIKRFFEYDYWGK